VPEPGIVTFRLSKRTIRATLAYVPRASYPDAYDALSNSLSSPDPVEVRLPERLATEWLYWLKSAAYRHTKDGTGDAPLLVEAAQSLEFAINSLS
jgi:hypothetical protein